MKQDEVDCEPGPSTEELDVAVDVANRQQPGWRTPCGDRPS
ncbi:MULTISPECIES: hypothetical protein [Micromonospora]|nr:hypothetical protein [Micromonospora antibiotica]